ncbi:hypothetical protein TNCV_2804561 [Trichonephila clavipes]|nr:hypothetical protein TNCV_2804561 [Trichonephila clavipes]
MPAPGNRSNETHDIERRTWQRQRSRVRTRRERRAVARKTWSDKEETAGRCIEPSTFILHTIPLRLIPSTPDFPMRVASEGATTLPLLTSPLRGRLVSRTATAATSASSSSTAGCPGALWGLRADPSSHAASRAMNRTVNK